MGCLRRIMAAALLALGLLACGGGTNSGAGPKDTVLVFARGSDSVGLDPALETDGESMKVCDNLYENLVTYAAGTTEVIPQLARSWDVGQDGRHWTFHLRTDVTFHDGTPFDAEAVLFSLGRQFFPDHPFHKPAAGTYSYWKDMGMDAVVADMSAVDDSTFVIELAEANAPFLSNLGMNFCAILSPTAVRRHGADYFKNPVGTGPFRFVEWRKDERIVLARNEQYWDRPSDLDRLIFKYVQDPSVRYLELRSGAVHGMDNLSPEFIDAIRQDADLKLQTQPGMNVGYLAMNMERPPYDDVRVRRAVNHAVNKRSLVDNFYAGLAVPAINPIPPMMWSYHDGISGYEHDPRRARELLAEADLADGFDTELWVMTAPRPYMPQPGKIAQAIQADLAQVGIRARIVTLDWATYLDKVFDGQHGMCVLGWTGDNGDPDNFLYVLLDKTAAVKPAQNVAFYKSDVFHDLLVAARRSTDVAQRTRLYRRAQEIVHADAPWVPLVHATQTAAFRGDVKGFELHPTGSKWFRSVAFGP